jgi:NAD dependent epimerase/dehydratase family enzyme
MHLVIAGASGFLGSHLAEQLRDHGHEVTTLTRGAAPGPRESSWRPDRGEVDQSVIDRADVVVNLAGSPTLGNPHSKTWQRNLRESRVTTTRTLAEAIAASPSPPAFLAGNAMGWYGDHGEARVTDRLTHAMVAGVGVRRRLPRGGFSTRTLTFRRTDGGWVLAG